ncbi:hypothetical protein AWN90_19180 [Nocardia terpenica]|uniref:IrrE N-terminal-like domain-containing protein n=2 Tax=Nocardia terpenica TaxID=455432 RepID=A0A161Z6C1_9NOCA|nr:hypothetical protein AWN90_19180 [Nocardia terpenica]
MRYMILRRRVIRLLRRLQVEPSDGVPAIVAALTRRVGPITVKPHPLVVPGSLAITVHDPDLGVVIFVQETTTPEHQAHLLLHELAHVILGTTEDAAVVTGGDQHDRSGHYTEPAERDAEFVARLISTRIDLSTGAQLPAQADERAERLARTLQERIGW